MGEQIFTPILLALHRYATALASAVSLFLQYLYTLQTASPQGALVAGLIVASAAFITLLVACFGGDEDPPPPHKKRN